MPVEVTDQYVRVRVREPGDFQDGSFRTVTLDEAKGILSIMGRLQGQDTMTVQAYLFALDKGWTEEKAKAWVSEHQAKHATPAWSRRMARWVESPKYVQRFQVFYCADKGVQLMELSEVEQYLAQETGNIVLNRAAVNHAKALIRAGSYTSDAAWGFSAADGNRILGKPPREATAADWNRFGSWHLGINRDGNEASKDRFRFPFGKGGKVYRRALGAIAQRASQFGHTTIQEAASSLIEMIRQQEAKMSASDHVPEMVLIFFEEFMATNRSFSEHVELDKEGVPTAFRIVEFGKWSTTKYPDILVDQQAAKEVMAWFQGRGIRCVIDLEHQTFKTEQNGQPAPAVGWFDIGVRNDGIWAENVTWTDKGRNYLLNDEYKYFSPTGDFNTDNGRLRTITTLGLTNVPATNNQLPLVAADKEDPSTERSHKMDKVLETLGLAPEATEEQAVEAIKDIQTKVAEADKKDTRINELEATAKEAKEASDTFRTSVLATCELGNDKGVDDVKAYVATLKAKQPDAAKLAELEKTNTELTAKVEQHRIDGLLTEFATRITPANEGTAKDLAKDLPEAKFREMIANWPEHSAPTPKPVDDKNLEVRNEPTAEILTDGDLKVLEARAKAERWDADTLKKETDATRDAKKRILARRDSV